MTTEAQTIANTILSQISTNAKWSMGIPRNTVFALPETDLQLGGVSFKFTNCFKIRNGKVEIILHPSDTYIVKVYNQLGNLKAEFKDVYCENLENVLMETIGY